MAGETRKLPPGGGGGGGSGGSAGSMPTYQGAETNDATAFQYLLAWGLVLILAMLLNRSRWGHALIYYGLALSLLILVLVNYQPITAILAPASQYDVGGEQQGPNPVPEQPQDFPQTAPITARAPTFQVSTH